MAEPAFRGFVETTQDALLIFEGCKRGQLGKVTRRLQEVEKRRLIVSGAVFVFDEEQTGIKRWTDGLSWSPSRTLGNFLVYRELDKKGGPQLSLDGWDEGAALPPPTAGSMMDRPGPSQSTSNQGSFAGLQQQAQLNSNRSQPQPSSSSAQPNPANSMMDPNSLSRPRTGSDPNVLSLDRARERALVGSLTSSYRFRADGLVKKTISLSKLHMIGYYKIEDVTSGRLRTPSSLVELISLEISPQFLLPTYFRLPPVVEMGPDGQVRYKSEADASSPGMIRTGSGPGMTRDGILVTPVVSASRSRPASSSSSTRPSSPRQPNQNSTQSGPPGSPRRQNSSSSRPNQHYHPYQMARISPSLNGAPQQASYPFPSNPSSARPSPPLGPRPAFPLGIGASDQTFDSPEQIGPSGLSPALGMMSTSGVFESHWSSNGQFYQPRHPTPYVGPDHSVGTPQGNAQAQSSSIFAYEAPPIGSRSRQGSERIYDQQHSQSQGGYINQRPPPPPLNQPPLPPPVPVHPSQPLGSSQGYAEPRFGPVPSVYAQRTGPVEDDYEETVPPRSSYSSYTPQLSQGSVPPSPYTPYPIAGPPAHQANHSYTQQPQTRAPHPTGMVVGLDQGLAPEEEDDKRLVFGATHQTPAGPRYVQQGGGLQQQRQQQHLPPPPPPLLASVGRPGSYEGGQQEQEVVVKRDAGGQQQWWAEQGQHQPQLLQPQHPQHHHFQGAAEQAGWSDPGLSPRQSGLGLPMLQQQQQQQQQLHHSQHSHPQPQPRVHHQQHHPHPHHPPPLPHHPNSYDQHQQHQHQPQQPRPNPSPGTHTGSFQAYGESNW